MTGFFKSLGRGVLYMFGLPIYLVFLLICGVFSIFLFIFQTIKGFFLFVTGRSLYKNLPEDIEVEKILNPNKETPREEPAKNEQSESVKIEPEKIETVQAEIIHKTNSNTEEIDFVIEDNVENANIIEASQEEPLSEDTDNKQEQLEDKKIDIVVEEEKKEEKEEVIETYTPKSSKF